MNSQGSTYSDTALLKKCLSAIEEKAQLGHSNTWRTTHFERLSELIEEDTGVRLSAVTLKRIWGKVSYNSEPSISTLDALAQFIGHEHWIAFQQDAANTGNSQFISHIISAKKIRNNSRVRFFVRMGILVVIFIATIISFIALSSKDKAYRLDSISFDFSALSEGVPNTVLFTYDVANTGADSFFIQQTWDPRLRHPILPTQNNLAITYYYPGVFRAKLILDETIVQEKDLYIGSGGWLGCIEKNLLPFYFGKTDLQLENGIGLNEDHLVDKGFQINQDIPFSSLYLLGLWDEIPGNDLVVHTRFKHTLGKGEAICQNAQFYVLGSDIPIIVPFSIPGCTGELTLLLPDKRLEGQQFDLSAFGVDYSDWVDLKLELKDHKLKIKVNGSIAYEDTLTQIPEKFYGVRYRFHGTGQVEFLNISASGTVIYNEIFNKSDGVSMLE